MRQIILLLTILEMSSVSLFSALIQSCWLSVGQVASPLDLLARQRREDMGKMTVLETHSILVMEVINQ